MGLLNRFQPLLEQHTAVKASGSDPFGITLERVLSPSEAVIDGRPTILAGTNNYLGLTFDADCIEAAVRAVQTEGTGTTGSRIANGSYSGHRDLERELAAVFGREHAMVFTTGYQANLSIISTVVSRKDLLVVDRDCHASIYDACRLSGATVVRFKHNDVRDLECWLERLSGERGDKLIVVEGFYSIIGDRAPLAEVVAAKKKYGAYLLLDEAHSFGVLGAHGRGLAEEAGVEADIDFVVGTFSKSLGAVGGFCVSSHPNFDILRVTSRPYMFTASLPPSTIASVRAALRAVERRSDLRAALWRNVDRLYDGLRAQGFMLGPEKGPIVAVYMPSPLAGLQAWRALLEDGVYVNLAVPPATPGSSTVLRCSVSAAHTDEQLKVIIAAFDRVGRALNLTAPPSLPVNGRAVA